jgi:hypothetical protein
LPITGPDATGSLAVAAILLSTGLLCRVLARPRRGPAA